jgi:hypothetical protein
MCKNMHLYAFLGHRGVIKGPRGTPHSDSMGTIVIENLDKMM